MAYLPTFADLYGKCRYIYTNTTNTCIPLGILWDFFPLLSAKKTAGLIHPSQVYTSFLSHQAYRADHNCSILGKTHQPLFGSKKPLASLDEESEGNV